MKEEILFKWIVNLLSSHLVKGVIIKRPGCKKDFERIAGASENSNLFSEWFYDCVKDGSIEYYGEQKINKSKTVKSYLINRKKMDRKLCELQIYEPLMSYLQAHKYVLRTEK